MAAEKQPGLVKAEENDGYEQPNESPNNRQLPFAERQGQACSLGRAPGLVPVWGGPRGRDRSGHSKTKATT